MPSETDAALALGARAGEPEAIERLVQTYQDALYSYALHLLGDADDAREVAQDALARACRALAGYDEERCRALEPRPWLFRIARNLAANRRRATRPAAPLPPPDGWHAPALRDTTWPGQGLVAEEERQGLWRALGTLGQTARDIVLLRFMVELSYAEIAAATGMSEAAARGQVYRALRQLRRALVEQEAGNAM